jgi:hypothetical protein
MRPLSLVPRERHARTPIPPPDGLTRTECDERTIERIPTSPHHLKTASIEGDGSLVLWSGDGDRVVIQAHDHRAIVGLLSRAIVRNIKHILALRHIGAAAFLALTVGGLT